MHINFFETVTPASIVTLSVGVLSFVVGALVYLRDTKRRNTRIFFLLAITVAIWSVISGLLQSGSYDHIGSFLVRGLYIAGISMPFVLLFFTRALSAGEIRFNNIQLPLLIAPFISVIILIVFSDLIVWYDVTAPRGWEYEIAFGPLFPLFAVYALVLLGMNFVVLWKKYREGAGVFKIELRYIMLTLSIAMISIALINLALQFLGYYSTAWLGHLVALFAISVIGYLMIKYNFWNMKLATTELFASLVSITLFIEILFSRSVVDFVTKGTILVLVISSSVFLVKSVKNETESKRRVEKLVEELGWTNARLQELDKKKSDFVEVAAHHLRDPLTVIRGYASMILEGSFGVLSAESRSAVAKIFESTKRLFVIIEEFMNISKIESGEIEYQFEKADISKIVTDVFDEMKLSAATSDLEFTLEVDEGKTYKATVDKGKIRQVVSNLIDNALKYSLKGGVKVRVYKDRKKKIVVTISDTGIGMAPVTLKKIFKKFSRADNASKFHTGGSGLGLYVAKEIIRNHGGRIWAESLGLGKGSTFFVEIDPTVVPRVQLVKKGADNSAQHGPDSNAPVSVTT